MRRKRKVYYTLEVFGYWWCAADRKWYKDTETHIFGTKRLSSFRRLYRMNTAWKAVESAPKSAEIMLCRYFYKHGRRYVAIWEGSLL